MKSPRALLKQARLLTAWMALFAVGCVVDEPDTEEVEDQSHELTLDGPEFHERETAGRVSKLDSEDLTFELGVESESNPFGLPGDEREEPTPTPWDPGVKPPPENDPDPSHGEVAPAPT